MIYLIGGPPKCGKTTFSKLLAKNKGIPWISSDALQVVARRYVAKYASPAALKKMYPHATYTRKTNDALYTSFTPTQIAKNYMRQARSTYDAIDMFVASELADGNDYIVEGYHVTPQLAARLQRKYGSKNFKVIFLGKRDISGIVQSFPKSATHNDWVLAKTRDQETFVKIAEMISVYSKHISAQAKQYGFRMIWTDADFKKTLQKLLKRF